MDKKKRKLIQFSAALLQNGNLAGFLTGKIYRGDGKLLCLPGLNCYSCPGAVGACPIGSLQFFLSSRPVGFPYYVLGCLLFFGVVFGRAVCGFLCPFGLIQELLYKLPVPKRHGKTIAADQWGRKCKYFVLLVFVIALPLALSYTPAFCKWLCPVGSLEGAIALTVLNSGKLNFPKGILYWWKLGLLALVALASIWIFRPFCRYICPLGAIYGCANSISIYRGTVERTNCIACGKCSTVCPMQVDPLKNLNSAECIRCGACASACPGHALHFDFQWPFPAETDRPSTNRS